MKRNRLLKKLGFPMDTKLLIIHADDIGLCQSQNKATFAAFEKGIVNSGSIMATCKGFSEIKHFVKNNANLDLGVHLTLTSEWNNYKWGPVLSAKKVPSLVDKDGFFLGEEHFENFNIKEVECELTAQIEKILEAGISPTHIDSHMNCMYKRTEFMELYLSLSQKYNIPVLINKSYLQYFNINLSSIDLKSNYYTNAIYIANHGMKLSELCKFYEETLLNIQPGLNTILLHLAQNNSEMKQITDNKLEFGSEWRQTDFDFFTSELCKNLIEENGIKLITWKQINNILKN